MRKVILSLALAAGISATASAQATFGVKAGASLTSFTGADAKLLANFLGSKDIANKFGAHGGLVANFAFSDALSVQPEVLFSMKGAKFSDNDKLKYNLNYVDIPVMVQYNADGLFFEAGPQLGILTTAKLTDGTNDFDTKSSLNTVDFG